jgi:hypothetical protein
MKKTVAYFVVVALLSNCAHSLIRYRHYETTKPVVISVRVGETIEPEERGKYNLFPEIDGFKTAVFYGIADGSYEVRIIAGDKSLVAVNRDSLAVMILRDYINRYEEIQNSKREFEEKWKIVDYDNLGQPITQYELNRIRKPGSGMLIGGATGCVGGFFAFLALAELIGENADVVFFSGWALSTATGAWLGEKMSRDRALRAIKESREPRVVE